MNLERQEEGQPVLFSPVQVLGKNYHLKIDQNECRVNMARIFFSRGYRFSYLIFICTAACSAVVVSYQMDITWWIVVLTALVITYLIADAMWRASTQGLLIYFKEYKNLIDFSATIFTVVLLSFGILQSPYWLIFGFFIAAIKLTVLICWLQKIVNNMHQTEMSIIDLNDINEVDRSELDKNSSGIVLLNEENDESTIKDNPSFDFHSQDEEEE